MGNKDQSKRLSNESFFLVVEFLRTHRERVIKEASTYAQLAELVSAGTGIPCSSTSMAACLKLAGYELESRRASGGGKASRHVSRVLTKSLILLFKKLGEEVPQELQALRDRLNKGITEEQRQEEIKEPQPQPKVVLPIPVKQVPASQTIPVVNNRR